MATKKDLKALGARRTQSKVAKTEDVVLVPTGPLKLDLGCGRNKKEGFYGVDCIDFDPVNAVVNLADTHWDFRKQKTRLPLKTIKLSEVGSTRVWDHALPDESVEEAHCSHFLEHLTWPERVNFLNELYRVLVPGGKCFLVIPHWASMRYYGDPTHKEPMSEFAFYYLDSNWRKDNAPHCGYTCHFNVSWGYGVHPEYQTKAPETQQFALKWYRDAATDIVGTMIKGPVTP